MKQKVSVILPVFNNAQSLPLLLSRIETIAKELASEYVFEIVMIDDGSVDDSWNAMMTGLGLTMEVVCLKLTGNFGQVGAILAGWNNCSGDLIVNMSADLQDPVELIPDLLTEQKKGFEIVLGDRHSRADGPLRSLTSKIASRILRNSIGRGEVVWFDVSLMSRPVLQEVLAIHGNHRFFQRDILYSGRKFSVVKYHRGRRPYGKSGFSQSLRFKLFVDAIVDSKRGLIQLFSVFSLLLTFGSVAYGIWIVVARILGLIPSSGWAPIMVAILFSTSLILLLLSVICEYLWRIYDNQRSRAQYVILQSISSTKLA